MDCTEIVAEHQDPLIELSINWGLPNMFFAWPHTWAAWRSLTFIGKRFGQSWYQYQRYNSGYFGATFQKPDINMNSRHLTSTKTFSGWLSNFSQPCNQILGNDLRLDAPDCDAPNEGPYDTKGTELYGPTTPASSPGSNNWGKSK